MLTMEQLKHGRAMVNSSRRQKNATCLIYRCGKRKYSITLNRRCVTASCPNGKESLNDIGSSSSRDSCVQYIAGASMGIDSRLLVINRLLQDFFLRSRQLLDENLGSQQFGQLLKPWSTVQSTFETKVDSLVNFLRICQLLPDLGSAT
jgi:hypothetical protein